LKHITWLALFTAIFVPRVYAISPAAAPGGNAALQAEFEPEMAVLMEAHRLSLEYGSRPPYNGPAFPKNYDLSPDQGDMVIPYLVACESRDKSIKDIDSNFFYSYGILQMQSSTVALFNSIDHTDLDPMIPVQAVQLAEIAIEHGFLSRWSCSSLENIVAPKTF
jgi:hypothetical protein